MFFYMFYRYEHYMSISHMALIVAKVHVDIWSQNLGMSFMIWFTTGLPRFYGDDQRSGWEQLGIYFGAACLGDRKRERGSTRPPENAIEERWKKSNTENKKEQMQHPPERKRKKVQHRKEKKKNSATPKEKRKKKRREKKRKRSKTTQPPKKKKKKKKEKKRDMKKRKRIRR